MGDTYLGVSCANHEILLRDRASEPSQRSARGCRQLLRCQRPRKVRDLARVASGCGSSRPSSIPGRSGPCSVRWAWRRGRPVEPRPAHLRLMPCRPPRPDSLPHSLRRRLRLVGRHHTLPLAADPDWQSGSPDAQTFRLTANPSVLYQADGSRGLGLSRARGCPLRFQGPLVSVKLTGS